MASATVIIVAYHGDRWIPRCIETLRQASQERFRLIIVDNVGNTVLDDLDVSAFDVIRLTCKQPMGFAEANNFALVNGGMKTDYVCFLNQDTVSGERWLDVCTAYMNEHPNVAAVSPLITTYEGNTWDPSFLSCVRRNPGFDERWLAGPSASGSTLLSAFGNPCPTSDRRPLNSDLRSQTSDLRPPTSESGPQTSDFARPLFLDIPEIPAAAMVARTAALRQVGPFDPIYDSYYEDYDLCDRMRKEGYAVGICAVGQVCHFSGSASMSPRALRRKARLAIRNRIILGCRRLENRRALWLAQRLSLNLPRRAARAALRRKGAQPFLSVVLASFDIIRLLPRLLSAGADHERFDRYLRRLGWAR